MAGTKHSILANVPTWVTPGGTYVAVTAASVPPTSADYLVGTADAGLSNEIVVGTSPGGELGGTWASPTVDALHSGTTHAGVISTHEAAADPHTGYQKESEKDAANGYLGIGASVISAPFPFYPADDSGGTQSASAFYAGSGAPNNANGADGDFFFRSDGGVLSTIYQRRAGAWVGVV